MEYHCSTCGMGVKDMACAKCGTKLVPEDFKTPDGKHLELMKCPNGHGHVKRPECCGKPLERKK